MGFAMPGRVKQLRKGKAVVEFFGSEKEVNAKFVNVKCGDFVLVQEGIIVEKLSDDEAAEIIYAWEQYSDEKLQAN